MGKVLRAVAALAIAVAMSVVGATPASPAPAQVEEGLRYEAHVVYDLDVAARAVHVALDVTVTNETPDVVSGGVISERYYPVAVVAVLAEATNFVAIKDDGRELGVEIEPTDSELYSFVLVDLAPDLFYPNSQTFRLTYDLPSQAPRSPGLTRINEAFATFTAFVLGDPGITSVQIQMPPGYEVELVGSEMVESEYGGKVIYTADPIADPDAWQVSVAARDDSKLVGHSVEVLDHEVEIQAWPDDQPWADFVDAQLADGLPVLQDLIGQPWPEAADDLTVIETVSPYLYGYAGWYRPDDDVIEIGDELDAIVVLHELSHMWFNSDLFADRWVNEGFAEEFSSRTLEARGEVLPAPEAIDPAAPGAKKLNTWSDPVLRNSLSDEEEAYGYNASWSVMRAVSAEIGVEKMSEVIAVASEERIPYTGDPAPEQFAGPFTWKALLDLMEDVGGSTQAAGLFAAHVVEADDAAVFEERAAARAA